MSQSWIPTIYKVFKNTVSKCVTRSKWQHKDKCQVGPWQAHCTNSTVCIFPDQLSEKSLFLPRGIFLPQKTLYFIGGSVRESLLCSGMPVTHHVGGKDENTFMFSTGPLRIIQKIWIILCSFSSFTSWGNEKNTSGHQIKSFKFPVSSLKEFSNSKH